MYKESYVPFSEFPPLVTSWKLYYRDFPGGPVAKNPPCNAADESLIPDRGTNIPYATLRLESLHCNEGSHLFSPSSVEGDLGAVNIGVQMLIQK